MEMATYPLEKSNVRVSTTAFKVWPNNNQIGKLPKASTVYLLMFFLKTTKIILMNRNHENGNLPNGKVNNASFNHCLQRVTKY